MPHRRRWVFWSIALNDGTPWVVRTQVPITEAKARKTLALRSWLGLTLKAGHKGRGMVKAGRYRHLALEEDITRNRVVILEILPEGEVPEWYDPILKIEPYELTSPERKILSARRKRKSSSGRSPHS